MIDVYNTIHQSLLAYCKNFKEIHCKDFQVFDFDAHATLNTLPPNNLIGIGEFELENNTEMYMCTVTFVISTLTTDDNLTLSRRMVGELFKVLTPGNHKLPIIDPNSGKPLGNMVVMDGVNALPVSRTETRPLQMIAVQLGCVFQTPP